MSARAVALLSGKGGVGRTLLTASLGARLAKEGRRVALVDLNTGMRGLDMALGLESRVAFDLGDVLDGVCELRQALVRGPDGLRLLAARQMRDTEELDEDALGRVMDALRAQFDWVLVDTAGGVGRGFTAAARCGLEALAVTTPDDASLRCVERAAGLWQRLGGEPPMLCVNRIRPALVEEGLQYTPQTCAQVVDLRLLGVVPEDAEALCAALRKTPLEGDSPAARGVENLLARLENPKHKLWDRNPAPPPQAGKPFLLRRRKA